MMKVNINTYTHEKIPVIEYVPDKPKKLIFINHGIYGSKDRLMHLLGMPLANIGYHVVAIDADKHGTRSQEPFASRDEKKANLFMFDVIKKTANDIIRLYEDKYLDAFSTFDVLGISMGGYTAYYLTLLSDQITTVIAMISSPNFSASLKLDFAETQKKSLEEEIERVRNTVMTMDPALRPHEIRAQKIIALNGNNDSIVPKRHTEKFFEDNPEIPHIHKVFDTGHRITRPMSEYMIDELKKTV